MAARYSNSIYTLTSLHAPSDKSRIEGSGHATTLTTSTALSALLNIANNRKSVTIRDFVLDANLTATACLVIGSSCQDILIERCTLKNAVSNLVQIGASGARVIFRHCTFQDTGQAALSVTYTGSGTTCVATVNATAFATACAGASGDNLNLAFATYTTVTLLAAAINLVAGYSASVLNSQGATACTSLTRVTANCKTTAFSWFAGRRDVLVQGPVQFEECRWIRTNSSPAFMLDVQASNVSALGNHFDSSTAAVAIYLSGNNCSDLNLSENRFVNIATSGVQGSTIFCDGTLGSGTLPYGFLIARNRFTTCNLFGGATVGGCISFGNAVTGRRGRSVTIADNVIEASGQGIFVGEYWLDVGITNNRLANLAPLSSAYTGQNAQALETHQIGGSVSHNTSDNGGVVGVWIGTNQAVSQNVTAEANTVIATPAASLGGSDVPIGMLVMGQDVTLLGNQLYGDATTGSSIGVLLQAGSPQDTARILLSGGNNIQNWHWGVKLATAGGFNVTDVSVLGNIIKNNSLNLQAGFMANVTRVGVRHNQGLVTEASGASAITAASTSKDVTHGLDSSGLDVTRIKVTIVQTATTTSDPGPIWVSAIGATTFTVNCTAAPGVSTLAFQWFAEVI